jgi:hypothetical protein
MVGAPGTQHVGRRPSAHVHQCTTFRSILLLARVAAVAARCTGGQAMGAGRGPAGDLGGDRRWQLGQGRALPHRVDERWEQRNQCLREGSPHMCIGVQSPANFDYKLTISIPIRN